MGVIESIQSLIGQPVQVYEARADTLPTHVSMALRAKGCRVKYRDSQKKESVLLLTDEGHLRIDTTSTSVEIYGPFLDQELDDLVVETLKLLKAGARNFTPLFRFSHQTIPPTT